MKYEFPFLSKSEVNAREFLMADDPYSFSTEERLRNRWIEESKILYGNFVPAGP